MLGAAVVARSRRTGVRWAAAPPGTSASATVGRMDRRLIRSRREVELGGLRPEWVAAWTIRQSAV